MDRIRFGIGAVWILLTIGATAFLGTEFVIHEIHAFIRHRRDGEPE
jgi:hypothetical protein